MTSNRSPEVLSAMADLQFLHGPYADLGVNVTGIEGNSTSWGGGLGYFVASRLVDLMDKDPTRKFPMVEVVDPTSGLAIPLELRSTKYSKVERTNLRNPTRSEKPSIGREGAFDLESYVRTTRGYRKRQLGAFTIVASDLFIPTVDQVGLGRSMEEGEQVSWGEGSTHPEAVAFISLANAYLDKV